MQFETQHLYHIYNQGNNHQKIFFKRENYLFFLEKIRTHILPYADVLAWCLMPNHFHLMVYVRHVELPVADGVASDEVTIATSDGVTPSQAASQGTTLSRALTTRSFNHSLGIMLASYTRAINIQQNWSGSLFRKETKAICLTKPYKNKPAYYQMGGINYINLETPEKQYPNVCYNYILNNPVKDGLATSPMEWEFTSFPDLYGNRNGSLICRERIKEYGLELVG